MGYCSKIFIVGRSKRPMFDTECVIASFDCCKMDYKFRDIFTKEIDYKLFADDGNTTFDTDKYGNHLKSADFRTVIGWLNNQVQKNDYRRLKPLLCLLKGFDLSQWQECDMQIVHYGY